MKQLLHQRNNSVNNNISQQVNKNDKQGQLVRESFAPDLDQMQYEIFNNTIDNNNNAIDPNLYSARFNFEFNSQRDHSSNKQTGRFSDTQRLFQQGGKVDTAIKLEQNQNNQQMEIKEFTNKIYEQNSNEESSEFSDNSENNGFNNSYSDNDITINNSRDGCTVNIESSKKTKKKKKKLSQQLQVNQTLQNHINNQNSYQSGYKRLNLSSFLSKDFMFTDDIQNTNENNNTIDQKQQCSEFNLLRKDKKCLDDITQKFLNDNKKFQHYFSQSSNEFNTKKSTKIEEIEKTESDKKYMATNQENNFLLDEKLNETIAILEIERAKNEELEEKLQKANKMQQEMRHYHNCLYQSMEEVQEEYQKVKKEKSQLKKQNQQLLIQQQQLQIQYQKQIEQLNNQIQKLQQQNQIQKVQQSILDISNVNLQNFTMDENDINLSNINTNPVSTNNNNNYIKSNYITKKKLNFSTIQNSNNRSNSYNNKNNSQQYQQQYIPKSARELECEREKKNQRSSSMCMQENNIPGNIQNNLENIYKQIIQKIIQKLKLQQISEIMPQIKLLQQQQDFIQCIIQMVKKCAPPGYYQQPVQHTPDIKNNIQSTILSKKEQKQKGELKLTWKFLKKVMEKYMEMRQKIVKSDTDIETLQRLQQILATDNHETIVQNIQALVQSQELNKKIQFKIKNMLGLNWTNTPQQLFKALHENEQFFENSNSNYNIKSPSNL